MVRSWLNVVSLEHAEIGLRGGFTQADHGRDTRLRRLSKGDGLVIYSPRTRLQGGAALQRFTAIGRIADDEPYRVEMTPEFHPWRRRVAFVVDATPVDVRPLLPRLSFITDERRWGYPFRRGLFEVSEEDLALIAEAMGADLPLVAGPSES